MITEKVIYIYKNFADPLRESLSIPKDISKGEATRIADCGILVWFFNGRYYLVPQAVLENTLSLLDDISKIEHPLNGVFAGHYFLLSDTQEIGPTILPLL